MVRNDTRAECVFPPTGESEEPECPHDRVTNLGQDAGNNVYDRCLDCGSVVVTFRSNDNWREIRNEKETHYESNWNPLLESLRTEQSSAEPSDNRTLGRGSLRGRIRGLWNRLRTN